MIAHEPGRDAPTLREHEHEREATDASGLVAKVDALYRHPYRGRYSIASDDDEQAYLLALDEDGWLHAATSESAGLAASEAWLARVSLPATEAWLDTTTPAEDVQLCGGLELCD